MTNHFDLRQMRILLGLGLIGAAISRIAFGSAGDPTLISTTGAVVGVLFGLIADIK